MDKVAELMPSRIEEAVKGTPIAIVTQVVDPLRIEAYVAFLLTKEVADMWNGDQRLNLQAHQIPTIAKTLIETFRNENLADFTICFRRGVMGFYNNDGEKLLRIDGSVVAGWMRKYLEEKYQVIEDKLMREKESPFENTKRLFQSVDASKYIKQLVAIVGLPDEKPKDNADANAYERYKLERQTQKHNWREELAAQLRLDNPEATEAQIQEFINNLK